MHLSLPSAQLLRGKSFKYPMGWRITSLTFYKWLWVTFDKGRTYQSQLYVWPFHECMWASLNQWGTSLVQKLCQFHMGHGYNPNCCSLALGNDLKCPLRECKCLLFICWFFLNGTVNVLNSIYDELELFGCLGQYKTKCPKWGRQAKSNPLKGQIWSTSPTMGYPAQALYMDSAK